MKKITHIMMFLAVAAVAGFGLAACDDDDTAATSGMTVSNSAL